MTRTPQDLRMQAREMETDARELESVISTIEFLNEHEGVVPRIDVEFPGFAHDGAKAASQLENWITEQWPERREQLLEHFRARRDELKEKWA